jgi:hypothetical protein
MDHTQFCKQVLSRVKLSSIILPIKYLKITKEEWEHIKYIVKVKQEEELAFIQNIKDKLWGKRRARREHMTEQQIEEDKWEFIRVYNQIYQEA